MLSFSPLNCSIALQTQPRIEAIVNNPMTAASQSNILKLVSRDEQLTRAQQVQARTDLQALIDSCLNPAALDSQYAASQAANLVMERYGYLEPLLSSASNEDGDRVHPGYFYEARLIQSAYDQKCSPFTQGSSARSLPKYQQLLNEKREQSQLLLNKSKLATISEVKDTILLLARLYLMHPEVEQHFLVVGFGVSLSDVYPREYKFNESAQHHEGLLAKSIEVCYLGLCALEALELSISKKEILTAIGFAKAEVWMQAAQGCYAHQPIVNSVKKPLFEGGSWDVARFRLKEAGKIYNSLLHQSEDAQITQDLQEKIADISVLIGCISLERNTTTASVHDSLPWALSYELESVRGDKEVSSHGCFTYVHVAPSAPDFTETCFQQAEVRFKTIVDSRTLSPKDWLRVHCKYASALVKQGLTLPRYHVRNDALRPLINKTLNQIKHYLSLHKNDISIQDYIRNLTKLADLIRSDAVQRPTRDPYNCQFTKQARKLLKLQQSKILANRASRLLSQNGGVKVMPLEAFFLIRRSPIAPGHREQVKNVYFPTAAALYEHESQWNQKIQIRQVERVEGKTTMHR